MFHHFFYSYYRIPFRLETKCATTSVDTRVTLPRRTVYPRGSLLDNLFDYFAPSYRILLLH